MDFKEKLRWMARMALLVFILGAAAFLSAITAMRLAIQGREVIMPELVAKTSEAAQNELAGLGLGMKIVDRVYSELPEGAVVRQSPKAGAEMKVSQRAHVVLSLGQREVRVPMVVGQSLRAARVEVLRSGLQVGEVSGAHLPGLEPEKVVQQNPPATGGNAVSPNVNLLVTLSPAQPSYVMPDLIGCSVAEAKKRLEAAGLRVDQVTYLGLATGDPNRGARVAGTSPARGSRIPAGVSVELQVVEDSSQ